MTSREAFEAHIQAKTGEKPQMIGGFDTNLRWREDWEIWQAAYEAGRTAERNGLCGRVRWSRNGTGTLFCRSRNCRSHPEQGEAVTKETDRELLELAAKGGYEYANPEKGRGWHPETGTRHRRRRRAAAGCEAWDNFALMATGPWNGGLEPETHRVDDERPGFGRRLKPLGYPPRKAADGAFPPSA